MKNSFIKTRVLSLLLAVLVLGSMALPVAAAEEALPEAESTVAESLPDEEAPNTEAEAEAAPMAIGGEALALFVQGTTQEQASQAVGAWGAGIAEAFFTEAGRLAAIVQLPAGMDEDAGVLALAALPEVEAAQPNFAWQRGPEPGMAAEPPTQAALQTDEAPATLSNDTHVATQWYLDMIDVATAWQVADAVQNEKVRVAVIDGGVDWTHPDIAANLNRSLSADFSTGKKKALSRSDDHGTQMAGIIGAQSNNGAYFAGIASGSQNTAVELISLDVFGAKGQASTYALLLAINDAVAKKAAVVNLSLGSYGKKDTVAQAVMADAVAAGTVLVASAGNDATNAPTWPSDYNGVIGVIALDYTGAKANYSNYNASKFIAAPGGGAFPGYDDYTGYMWNIGKMSKGGTLGSTGTSPAAAVVSGVVALMKYVNPWLSPAQVRDILAQTATDLYTPGKDSQSGWGCVNAGAAVTLAAATPVQAQSITLNMKAKTLKKKGKTVKLKAAVLPEAAGIAVSWESSKPTVATVDENGKVTAKKKGTATITATTPNGKTAKCKVRVGGVPVSKVKLGQKKMTLQLGTYVKLAAEVSPANASNKKVAWATSNPLVATVNSKGKVTAITPGKAKITATTSDGGIKAVCTVTVKKG